jgi:hypothetical protein
MEKNTEKKDGRRLYGKPEIELIVLNMDENIAFSGVYNDEFDGEDDRID